MQPNLESKTIGSDKSDHCIGLLLLPFGRDYISRRNKLVGGQIIIGPQRIENFLTDTNVYLENNG